MMYSYSHAQHKGLTQPCMLTMRRVKDSNDDNPSSNSSALCASCGSWGFSSTFIGIDCLINSLFSHVESPFWSMWFGWWGVIIWIFGLGKRWKPVTGKDKEDRGQAMHGWYSSTCCEKSTTVRFKWWHSYHLLTHQSCMHRHKQSRRKVLQCLK